MCWLMSICLICPAKYKLYSVQWPVYSRGQVAKVSRAGGWRQRLSRRSGEQGAVGGYSSWCTLARLSSRQWREAHCSHSCQDSFSQPPALCKQTRHIKTSDQWPLSIVRNWMQSRETILDCSDILKKGSFLLTDAWHNVFVSVWSKKSSDNREPRLLWTKYTH